MGYEPKSTIGGNRYLGPNGTFSQLVAGLKWIAEGRDAKDAEQKAAWEQHANAEDDAHSTADRAYTDSLVSALPNKQYVIDAAGSAEADAVAAAQQYTDSVVPSIAADPNVAGAYLIGDA